MKKLIYISFILIFASCVNSSDRLNTRAEKLIAEGRYVEANVLLDRAIERNPKNIFALMNRGANKSLLGDNIGAIEDYSRIIKIHNDNTMALVNRGKSRARLGDFHGAIEDFDRAIETIGGENNSTFRLVFTDNFFTRTEVCQFAVEMEAIRLERGVARLNLGYLQKAFEDLNYAIQWGFELAISYYMMGFLYIADGNIELACEMLMKALMLGNANANELLNEHCEWMLSADNL